MPVQNPAASAAFGDGDDTFSLADVPINRGMLAVMKELRERDVSEEQKMAMTWRLMHFGEVFDHREQLRDFIKEGDAPDELLVSEALVKACALARVCVSDAATQFDIADVARIAREISETDDDPGSS